MPKATGVQARCFHNESKMGDLKKKQTNERQMKSCDAIFSISQVHQKYVFPEKQ